MGRPEPTIVHCDSCDARVILSGVSRCESEGMRVCVWCALTRCAPAGHIVLDPPMIRR